MKKILSLTISVICFSLLTGCVSTRTVGTSAPMTLPIDTEVRPLPLAAGLKVSEQRSRGEAKGPAVEEERLTHVAIAKALGQDPPSAEGPDVLVGMRKYMELAGSDVKITVTGYPAWYTNFRTAEENDCAWLKIIVPDGCYGCRETTTPQKVPKSVKIRKHDYYFAARYTLPLGISSPFGAGNVEGGWVWGNGTFFGIDFNLGYWIGGALISLGGVYDLPYSQMQLVYGGSVGALNDVDWSYNYDTEVRSNGNFLGPFIKLRWKSFELSYRGLLGTYHRDYMGDDRYSDNLKHLDNIDSGFGWNNHQIMLGVYFATSKRVRK